MKKIALYSLMAAAVLALAGCAREKAYEPGPKDDPNCMGVYFPEQEGTGEVELDPADNITKLTFVAKRAESKSETEDVPAATVPVTVVDENNIFTVSPIVFEAGQIETTFEVSFPNAEVGVSYPCEIRIEDPKYASTYTSLPTSLSFTVTAVKWNPVEKDGIKVGSYKDFAFADMYGVGTGVRNDVVYEERDDLPGMYRTKCLYNAALVASIFGYSASQIESAGWITNKEGYFVIDATDPNAVVIPAQKLNLLLSSNDGEISLRSRSGYEGVLKDNVITFPASGIQMGFANAGWYTTASGGETKFILPGGKDTDYSMTVRQMNYTDNEGNLPVRFVIGADVKQVKYVLANKLRVDEIPAVAEGLAENADAVTITETGTVDVNINTEKTGVYTLVAAAFDEKGAKTAEASLELSYVAAGDDKSVVVSAILENVSEVDKAKGTSGENNLAFFVQGQEITKAIVKVYDYIRFSSDKNSVISDLYKQTPISEANLADLNGAGLSGFMSGLAPGTKYVLLVWATNGYDETIIAEGPVTTEGDPLPVYQDYSQESVDFDYAIGDEKDLYGSWNLYGVDFWGSLGVREYIGKAVFEEDTDHANDGPDSNGLFDQYVYASGFMGKYRRDGMPSDKIQMDLYNGLLYLTLEGPEDLAYTFNYYAKAPGKVFTGTGGLGGFVIAGVPVMDGYYAFIDVTQYASSYNFCGLFWRFNSGNYGAWYDYLIVDPAKDDNGLAKNSAVMDAAISNALNNIDVETITQRYLIQKGRESLTTPSYNAGIMRTDIRPERTVRFATVK